MVVRTDTERTDHSRKLVLELLGSSVDLSLTKNVERWNNEYEAEPTRFGKPAAPTTHRDEATTGHHHVADGSSVSNVLQPVKIDNELYVRDYSKCIMCYQCVDACGEQWQNTFAIGVAGRGFDIRISTEFNVDLTDSACVYCGNCIQVCPTGALMFTSEHNMREAGTWKEELSRSHRQAITPSPTETCASRDASGFSTFKTTQSRLPLWASRFQSSRLSRLQQAHRDQPTTTKMLLICMRHSARLVLPSSLVMEWTTR
jgi:predicted molibdopterin-dependent oxidoreductase YjgC